jgi:branched-chain amino acid transport system ATP-binding protein
MHAGEKQFVLQTEKLSKSFGALLAAKSITMNVSKGEVVAVIGPNGAGKTTFFNLISGVTKPTSGEIWFSGESISKLPEYEICQRGIVRTFQITQVFPGLTVLENIRLAAQFKRGGNFRIFGGKCTLQETRRKGEGILDFLGISHLADVAADHLSHGDQRLLELSMALVQDPVLLLLDEPTAGLSVAETHKTVEVLENVFRKGNNTILLVEHDMEVVFNLASRIIVLNFGEVIAEGRKEEIQRNEEVQRAYLGGFE